jgi:hypothetical protein
LCPGRCVFRTPIPRLCVVALPIVAPAAAVIVITLPVFYLVELLVWIPLKAAYGIQEKRRSPAKKVNRPAFRWKL